MKSLILATAVALTSLAGVANATPIDPNYFAVHGSYGQNDYGR
jgi:hypothetical protein